MEFESLQAIWDTQDEKPVFAMQDPRLAVALYQQREHSRRRLFRQQFAPMYVAALSMLAVVGFIFFAFLWKSLYIEKIARDFPMSVWDYAAFAVAAGSLMAIVAILYPERKKHERTQNVFAPSLREELDRGLAQLDFELRMYSAPRLIKIHGLLYAGVLLLCWESGRLNGEPTSWSIVFVCVSSMAFCTWSGIRAQKKKMEQLLPHRRVLESMRASLEEEAVSNQ